MDALKQCQAADQEGLHVKVLNLKIDSTASEVFMQLSLCGFHVTRELRRLVVTWEKWPLIINQE